jgi:hypothetical protein
MQRHQEWCLNRDIPNLYKMLSIPGHTDGAHVCTFDSSDYQGCCPHAGSAGLAGTVFAGSQEPWRLYRGGRNSPGLGEMAGYMMADGIMGMVRHCSRDRKKKSHGMVYRSGADVMAERVYVLSNYPVPSPPTQTRLCRVARGSAQRRSQCQTLLSAPKAHFPRRSCTRTPHEDPSTS